MPNPLASLHVLIVDDEPLMNKLVRDVLLNLGFAQITTAHNGREAIMRLMEARYDFLISDWRMPDIDGMGLVRFLRHSPQSPCPRIPIILLTGNTEEQNVIEARDAGVTEYMIKPFSVKQLTIRIQSIIEQPRGFVEAPVYHGPDRRWHMVDVPEGHDRRKYDD